MSVYSIVYQGGFALPKSLEELDYLMRHNSNVSVMDFNSDWGAYCSCCYKRSKDKLKSMRNNQAIQQPLMPTFEEVFQVPFHEPGFVEIVPPNRFFAIINIHFFGIYTEVESAIEFLNFYHSSWLKEFSTLEEAQFWINCKYMSYIFPRMAYINNSVPYIQQVQINHVMPVNYVQWLKENLQMPQSFSFPRSQFLLPEHS